MLSWAADDPLADAFLAQFGDFPGLEEIGIDYRRLTSEVTGGVDVRIVRDEPVPRDILDHR
jgi:hypothetical protein